jgi:HSP20 family protein
MKNAVATPDPEASLTRENNTGERSYVTPEVNIFETKDGFVLEAEMPGVSKDTLEITLEGNALTLVGHRDDGSEGRALYRESKPAHFRRVFELDPAIDTGKINAKVEQGVLTLTLPKAEKVKPRKIAVGD